MTSVSIDTALDALRAIAGDAEAIHASVLARAHHDALPSIHTYFWSSLSSQRTQLVHSMAADDATSVRRYVLAVSYVSSDDRLAVNGVLGEESGTGLVLRRVVSESSGEMVALSSLAELGVSTNAALNVSTRSMRAALWWTANLCRGCDEVEGWVSLWGGAGRCTKFLSLRPCISASDGRKYGTGNEVELEATVYVDVRTSTLDRRLSMTVQILSELDRVNVRRLVTLTSETPSGQIQRVLTEEELSASHLFVYDASSSSLFGDVTVYLNELLANTA